MRIIAGEKRGRKLTEFAGDDVRPTTDRVRESVFNIIQTFIPDSYVLDLFSGSGALSLEALSRGADSAVCVDIDPRSIAIIKKNADATGYTDKCDIKNMSCFDFLDKTGDKFDVIFLDPPYNKGFIEPVMKKIAENRILNDGGIVMLESDSTDFHGDTDGFSIYRQRRYGRTYVTVYIQEG